MFWWFEKMGHSELGVFKSGIAGVAWFMSSPALHGDLFQANLLDRNSGVWIWCTKQPVSEGKPAWRGWNSSSRRYATRRAMSWCSLLSTRFASSLFSHFLIPPKLFDLYSPELGDKVLLSSRTYFVVPRADQGLAAWTAIHFPFISLSFYDISPSQHSMRLARRSPI
jgi:hypothetical protein